MCSILGFCGKDFDYVCTKSKYHENGNLAYTSERFFKEGISDNYSYSLYDEFGRKTHSEGRNFDGNYYTEGKTDYNPETGEVTNHEYTYW